MEKKYYQQPNIRIICLKQTDLICTSNKGSKASTQGLDEEDFNW